MTLRAHVFDMISGDARFNALGITADTLFHGQTMDTPPDIGIPVFAVLAWQNKEPALSGQRGPGRSYEQLVDFYVYDRARTFKTITDLLALWQVWCDEVFAVSTGTGNNDGWISCVEWNGEGIADYDEVYQANMRYGSATIVAKGN